mmetsp:Transcript_12239/g.25356  ORF Transcript_12239/g.25356 Transcript_12239/m.25356 type:complete len:139 (+) Transcript_12239:339-755(+)
MPPHNPHAPSDAPLDAPADSNATAAPEQVKPRVLSSMASVRSYSVNSGNSVVPLRPAVKDYAWGIRGLDSRVARFALESGIIDEVDPDMPYAELWIGTHEKVGARAALLWIHNIDLVLQLYFGNVRNVYFSSQSHSII